MKNKNEILEKLRYANKEFPKEEIEEIKLRKEEFIKDLLDELIEVNNNIEKYANNTDYFMQFYAMYLLAEFEEKSAFPIIIDIISKDSDLVDNLLSETITEDLPAILASTYDGNFDLLYHIIISSNINEMVRVSTFTALEILEEKKMLDQSKIVEVIENTINHELRNDTSFIICEFVRYIANHKIYGKMELVRELYNRNQVNEQIYGDYASFIDDIFKEENIKDASIKEKINTIAELSTWACFKGNSNKLEDLSVKDLIDKLKEWDNKEISEKFSNKEVGRNDLCPCGSGKKYKKCCINKEKIKIAIPEDPYILRAMSYYPNKEKLKLLYDEEKIEIDEKLYYAFCNKRIPIWVNNRQYKIERERYIDKVKEAIILIKEKCEKEHITTVEQYDKEIAIHYSFREMVYNYIKILEGSHHKFYEDYESDNIEKVNFIKNIININQLNKNDNLGLIHEAISGYIELEQYNNARLFVDEIMEKYPNDEQIVIELCEINSKDDSISFEENIQIVNDAINEFGETKKLISKRFEIYLNYIDEVLYSYENEEKAYKLAVELFEIILDLIKKLNIRKQEDFDCKLLEETSLEDIIYDIAEVFRKCDNKSYAGRKISLITQLLDKIQLLEVTKEDIYNALAQAYFDIHDDEQGIKMIENFLEEYPNNAIMLANKADLYIDEGLYKEAIDLLEEKINNKQIDDIKLLYSKLAIYYDKIGNEEEANKYQKLAIEENDGI